MCEAEVTTVKAAEPWDHEPIPWSLADLGSDPDSAASQLGLPHPQFLHLQNAVNYLFIPQCC